MKDKGLKIGLSVLRSIIIAIGGILVVLIATRSEGEETYDQGVANYGSLLDGVYNLTLVALVICAAAAVVFGLIHFFANIKNRMGSLIGIAVFVVIGLISFYGLADSTVLSAYESSGIEVTAGESAFAGGGIIFVYLLGAVAFLTIVWTEVKRIVQ